MTALASMGLVPPPGRVAGSIRIEGREMVGQPPAVWRQLRGERVAMVFQEPMSALNPVMTVGRQIAEVMVIHQGLTWRQADARAVEGLAAVGINAPQERARAYPHQLSGGMRQRAMIAMALACRPALLIADEPTTALDVTIQAQIIDLMLGLQDETGMAIQFISHNLAVVSEVAHEIIVMYSGRVVERASAEALFADPLHPYTVGLIATLPDPAHRVAELPVIRGGVPDLDDGVAGCRFADRCPPRRRRLPRGRAAARGTGAGAFRRLLQGPSVTALVSLDHVHVRFPVGRRLLRAVEDVTLDIAEGETLALVGESGSGKSTLGNVVAGLQMPTEGAMQFRGRSVAGAVLKETHRAIQIVFQDPFGALDPRMPVSAIIAEPLRIGGMPTAQRQARVEELIGQVGLPRDALNRYPHEFSGGPAPAYRHRPRTGPRAGPDRGRRAALGAGRVDPEPGAEPVPRRAAGGAGGRKRARLSVHQP